MAQAIQHPCLIDHHKQRQGDGNWQCNPPEEAPTSPAMTARLERIAMQHSMDAARKEMLGQNCTSTSTVLGRSALYTGSRVRVLVPYRTSAMHGIAYANDRGARIMRRLGLLCRHQQWEERTSALLLVHQTRQLPGRQLKKTETHLRITGRKYSIDWGTHCLARCFSTELCRVSQLGNAARAPEESHIIVRRLK